MALPASMNLHTSQVPNCCIFAATGTKGLSRFLTILTAAIQALNQAIQLSGAAPK
jgi:hypothetical protein